MRPRQTVDLKPKQFTYGEIVDAIKARSVTTIDQVADELRLPGDDVSNRLQLEMRLNNMIRQKKIIPVDYQGRPTERNEFGYRTVDKDGKE